MEFQNLKYSNYDRTCTFRLQPIHVAYINTLRRLIMTGVETVGFRADMTNTGTTTDVKVTTNTTPMTNEMLAHRIGLLPIHIKNPLKAKPDLDKYTFTLKATADKDRIRDVTCSDFVVTKSEGEGKEDRVLETALFFRPHPLTRGTCLITTLAPGSGSIELVAKPSVGTGRENARFQPTSQCSYVYTRDEDPEAVDAYFTKWLSDAKKVDRGALKDDDPKLATLRREFMTMEVARVFLKDEKGQPFSYDMTVESVGTLDIPYIVLRACDVGEAMVGKYVNLDTRPTTVDDDVAVLPTTSRILGFDFLIRNQDHTLGNLLQTWLAENHMEPAPGSNLTKIDYVGYEVPHPLRDEMVLRIGTSTGSKEVAIRAFVEACKGCAEMFRSLRNAWIKVNPGVNSVSSVDSSVESSSSSGSNSSGSNSSGSSSSGSSSSGSSSSGSSSSGSNSSGSSSSGSSSGSSSSNSSSSGSSSSGSSSSGSSSSGSSSSGSSSSGSKSTNTRKPSSANEVVTNSNATVVNSS